MNVPQTKMKQTQFVLKKGFQNYIRDWIKKGY